MLEMLEKTIAILRENGTTQIAMTVSPVPLARTMTNKDVLIANTYSKSTLRSAVGLICDRHDFVHYVPSFEKVMLSKNEDVWKNDLRHVADGFVGLIASGFAAATGVTLKSKSTGVEAFNKAFQSGNLDEALQILDGMGSAATEVGIFGFHRNAGSLLAKKGRWADALPHARQVQKLRSHVVAGYKMEYRCHRKLKDEKAAAQIVDQALRNCAGLTKDQFLAGKKKRRDGD